MKLTFQGEVTPTKYDESQWYVEGVGSQIKLINSKDLIIPAAYTESKLIPFDTDKITFFNCFFLSFNNPMPFTF